MNLINDVFAGLRSLRRSPGFLCVAVLTLGPAIGANTALFSVVNAVLLRSFGYADAGRLVQISGTNKQGQSTGVSVPDLRAFQTRSRSLAMVGAARLQSFTLTGPREPENLYGQLVSAECLATLGAVPLLGRTFAAGDFQSGATPTVILSHRLWQASFDGDPGVIGRRVLMNGSQYTVIGVMRPEFQYPHPAFRLWAPLQFTAEDLANHSLHTYTVVARLRRGATRQAAQAELNTLSQALAAESPATNNGWRAVVDPVSEKLLGNLRPALFTLLGAVGFVLLIACLNVANLTMARGVSRSRDLAVHAALGAGRLRLIRQLLTESLLISLMGGALGIVLAQVWLKALLAMLPARSIPVLPGADQASLNAPVLLVSIGAVVISGIVFGLLPALQASRPNLEEALREGSRSNTGGRGRLRLLGGLIAVETALSVILLAGAALLIHSFANLMEVDLGFRPEHVLTLQIPSEWENMARRNDPAETRRKMRYFEQIVHGLQGIPGVNGAALVTVLPLGSVNIMTRIYLEGRPAPAPGEDLRVSYRAVSAGYFRTMGIPVLRGRDFAADDEAERPLVVVISEAMARRFWPNQEAVGQRLTLNNATTGPWMTVVGVVGSVRFMGRREEPEAELYTSYSQTLLAPQVASVVLRTALDPMTLVPSARAVIRQANPNQPIADVKTMSQVVSDSLSQSRLYTVLLAVFAGLALVLAAAGIFSVISWTVTQATHEIGIRVALGATPADVRRAVMMRPMLAAGGGTMVGLAGASALTHILQQQLLG